MAARWGAAVSRLCNDLAGLIVVPREWGSVVASLGHPIDSGYDFNLLAGSRIYSTDNPYQSS